MYQDAFNTFSSFLEPQLKNGRAFEMSRLTEKYKEILMELGVPCDEVEKYRTQTLKSRILNAFSDKVVICDQNRKNISQIIYSSSIDIKDVINSALEYK